MTKLQREARANDIQKAKNALFNCSECIKNSNSKVARKLNSILKTLDTIQSVIWNEKTLDYDISN